MEVGRYDDAAQAARAATQRPAIGARLANALGEALYARGKVEEAEQAFRQSVDANAPATGRASNVPPGHAPTRSSATWRENASAVDVAAVVAGAATVLMRGCGSFQRGRGPAAAAADFACRKGSRPQR